MMSQPEQGAAAVPEAVVRFCSIAEPYAPDAQYDGMFIEAMQAITEWHIQRSPWYREFARLNAIVPDKLTSMDKLIAMPPVHANFFKAHEIRSITQDEVVAHMTSSGTTGQKSQMFMDTFTFEQTRQMVRWAMSARGVMSDQACHYLVNAYEPFEGIKVGTSRTNQFLMQFAPVAEQCWTLRHIGGGEHQFDVFGAMAALQAWSQGDTPVRIIGFPAFLHFILQRMRDLGVGDLRLPKGSLVIFGGGWKGHADQAISREQLHANIQTQLGMAADRIVETFGSVEHSIPYIASARQRLHQPTWSRVVVRDVKTLQPVADGQPGFLSFISPYITSAPAHSVVMGDMAVRYAPNPLLEPDEPPTPWFEVLGRAGVSANKSCAAAAAELLK
ncbi:MAG: hypothetical protein AB7D03_10395 [Thiomicrospira sp.]